ncbi:3-oxoacyl-reductase [Durotheca rogersii]|uniref:3-oxoacyl-reductase n=1 Tax=Durotheca rogersii TaxID=419775 RepID=UPI00221EFFF8|nr:3-oxoacyl-reductase [Durotheca rogersii]KAI5867753.1 3-oxoacyl-reductase [Durotheca rogersii]
MPSSLAGKVIFITGAASGIGRSTAIKLHGLGAVLVLTDINEPGLAETLALCGGGGGGTPTPSSHSTFALDVSDPEAVDRVVAAAAARHGRLDHVFNCAGINPTAAALTATSVAYFDRLVGANLKGVFNVTKATAPHVAAPGGSYVNVSSISGWNPTAGTAVYCATKFAVVGFSKCMALELGPAGVRVNVVAPGYIDTPTNAGIARGTPEARLAMEQGNALGRMGTPADVADVVAFLMSDGARYMNGSVVQVDGMLKT